MSKLTILLYSFTATIGIIRYKKLNKPFQLLSMYLIFSFLDAVANKYIIAVYKNNVLLLHVETIVNYIFFSLIYYYLFKNQYIKRSVLLSIVIVIIISIINSFYLQPYNQMFPTNTMLINEVLFILFSLALFKQMLLYPLQVNIIKQSMFWFNAAMLFYSATIFFNSTLANYFYHHNVKSSFIGYFWYFVEITSNLLLGIAILTDKREINTIDAQ